MRDWDAYFSATDAGRDPRPLLTEALAGIEPVAGRRQAVDLGFGHGVETVALLEAGWDVYAVDGSAAAVWRLLARVPITAAERLTAVHADLGEVTVPPCDVVWAGFSLFFIPPDRLTALWASLRSALRPGGRFAGQFLGDRDTWASDDDTTGLTKAEVENLLAGMTIEHFTEQEEDGSAVSGPKHWHVFHVIASVPS